MPDYGDASVALLFLWKERAAPCGFHAEQAKQTRAGHIDLHHFRVARSAARSGGVASNLHGGRKTIICDCAGVTRLQSGRLQVTTWGNLSARANSASDSKGLNFAKKDS